MPEIVQFPAANLSDIPLLLRNIADSIEAGDYGSVANAVLVLEQPAHDWPSVFGLGADAIPPRSLWLLELAKGFLVTNHVART